MPGCACLICKSRVKGNPGGYISSPKAQFHSHRSQVWSAWWSPSCLLGKDVRCPVGSVPGDVVTVKWPYYIRVYIIGLRSRCVCRVCMCVMCICFCVGCLWYSACVWCGAYSMCVCGVVWCGVVWEGISGRTSYLVLVEWLAGWNVGPRKVQ